MDKYELIAQKEARKKELGQRAQNTNDIPELRRINEELETLNAEIAELREQVNTGGLSARSYGSPIGATRILGTYGLGQGAAMNQRSDEPMNGNVYASQEYRSAFMNFVLTGTRSDILEQRANATTLTSDIGTVIPTTIMNKVYEKMSAYSMIWNLITKANVKGGIAVPISSLKPIATWVAEGSLSDKQKKTTGSVTFNLYKLQCRVAISLEASTASLDMFESTVVENIYEAMIIAVEKAVVSGTGVGQPLGIIKDTSIPVGQIITVTAAEISTYDKWAAIIGSIPLAYESKVVLTLTKKDWDKHIAGMVDANGQPIARINLGLAERPERRVLGYNVVLVDDYLTSFDSAQVGDVFGYFADYRDYIFNSNLQMLYKKYFDEDTDEVIHKATELCDGKLAVPHSVILLKKG